MAEVRVRFAPSPTGYLHIGGARTALFNWLYARQHGGSFVLRMEDTDEERNTTEARETIFRGLEWLGLDPDEGPEEDGPLGPYSQSERAELYLEWAEKMRASGALYPCFCTKERLSELRAEQEAAKVDYGYDGRCRDLDAEEVRRRIEAGEPHTWRLRVPEGKTYEIEDLIRGTVRVESKDIEDVILVRATGVPVYNFAVVVDDHLMQISHVIRGEDHLTNTFKQVVIYDLLGLPLPTFAHLPLILGPTGQGKLSKRKHPEAALELYQKQGYPVEGLINWLALIGWSLDGETETFTREDLIEKFSLERVQKSGARLPMDKLDAICGDAIRRMQVIDVAAGIRPFLEDQGWMPRDLDLEGAKRLEIIAAAFHERLRKFSEIIDQAGWIFAESVEYEPKSLKNLRKEGAADLLEAYGAVLLAGPLDDAAALEEQARAWVEEQGVGFGKLVHPVRAALTGRTAGPGLFDCAVILGRDTCGKRIEKALEAARAEAG